MKIKHLLLAATALAVSFTSCIDDKEYVYEGDGIRFNSTIAGESLATTRAANAAWEVGDAIGVFMKTGDGLTNIVDNAANQEHTTATVSGEQFVPADPKKNAIFFPSKGAVDFIAYYPYVKDLAENTYKVDVTKQASQEKIDLLYSNDATGKSSGDKVTLGFKHELTKVVFTLTAANVSIDLKDVVVSIDNMPLKGDFDLGKGILTASNEMGSITMKSSLDATNKYRAIAEAIVIPTAKASRKVSFTFKRGGVTETDTWDASNEPFDKGKKNTYNVQVGGDKGVMVSPGSTIEDWGPGSSEDIIIDLDGGGENPDPEPEPNTSLLFAGSDFNDWSAFLGGLTSHGLKPGYTSQSPNGREGSALLLQGTPGGNDYVFTSTVDKPITGSPTKIMFYVKGTAAKSLSLNVYLSDGTFKAYNLGDCTGDMVLDVAANNQYNGTINTGGKWAKITLNIADLELQNTVGQSLFALKVGKGAAYDLLIDDIVIDVDGGTKPDPKPEPKGSLLFAGSDFNDWSAFLGGLTSHGLKPGYTSQSPNGREGSALLLQGTPGGNDYVFTSTVDKPITGSPSKIIFYVKGTAAKSLSLNVYLSDGTFKAYNLGDCTGDMVLDVAANNQYNGTINTGDKWAKITLNIADLELQKTGGQSLFALKVGKDAAYDLLIDDITYE